MFDSGKVEVDGSDLGTLKRGQRTAFRARTIGFIFQFFNLLPTLTALENVSPHGCAANTMSALRTQVNHSDRSWVSQARMVRRARPMLPT